MSIQGTPGATLGTTKSATYSPTQYVEFIEDAEKLGLHVDVDSGHETKVFAYNADNKIAGEWSCKKGGYLSWP